MILTISEYFIYCYLLLFIFYLFIHLIYLFLSEVNVNSIKQRLQPFLQNRVFKDNNLYSVPSTHFFRKRIAFWSARALLRSRVS